MTTQFSSATAIDLSKLPPPSVVEQLDYPSIRDARLADFLALYPDYGPLIASDPVVKLVEVFAYRELQLRQDFNDRARALFVATANDGDLDHLAALVGVERLTITAADPETGDPAVMESNDALRNRAILAYDRFSVAGPEGAYIFHALSAHADVLTASASSPSPGEVVVTIQSRIGDGTASAPLLAAVEAVVNADNVRPLTDRVTVASATIVPVEITAALTLYPGPDETAVLDAANAALEAWKLAALRLGRDIEPSQIIAALHVSGVKRVNLTSPAFIAIANTEVGHVSATNLTVAGYDY